MIPKLIQFLEQMSAGHITAGVILLALGLALIWSRLGLGIYVALLFASISYSTASDLREIAPFLALIPAMFAIFLLVRLLLVRDGPRWPKLAWAWTAATVWWGLRSAFSPVGTAATYWWVYYGLIVCVALSLGTLMSSPRYRMPLVRWLAYASFGTIVLGFASAVIAPDDAFTQGRLTPFGVQANIWGPTSLVAFLNCFLYVQLGRGIGSRLPKIVMLGATAVSILASMSRGSLVAWIAGIIVYMFAARGERIRSIWIVGLLAVIFAIGTSWAISRGFVDTRGMQRLGTVRSFSREQIHIQLMEEHVLPNPVLGIGFFQKHGDTEPNRGDAHDSALQMWIEQGTVGLIMALALVGAAYLQLYKARKMWPPGSTEHTILVHACMALTAVFLDGLTVPHLWTHHGVLGFEFAMRVALVAALAMTAPRHARVLPTKAFEAQAHMLQRPR